MIRYLLKGGVTNIFGSITVDGYKIFLSLTADYSNNYVCTDIYKLRMGLKVV